MITARAWLPVLALAALLAGCNTAPYNPATYKANADPFPTGQTGATPPRDAPRPVTSAVPVAAGTYVVQPGDTVYKLSRRFGVPVRSLIETNRLNAPYGLLIGQRLVIPQQREHIVAAGETVNTVAATYGVAVSALARANNLQPPYQLRAGQHLILPDSVVPPGGTAPAPIIAQTPPTPGNQQIAALPPTVVVTPSTPPSTPTVQPFGAQPSTTPSQPNVTPTPVEPVVGPITPLPSTTPPPPPTTTQTFTPPPPPPPPPSTPPASSGSVSSGSGGITALPSTPTVIAPLPSSPPLPSAPPTPSLSSTTPPAVAAGAPVKTPTAAPAATPSTAPVIAPPVVVPPPSDSNDQTQADATTGAASPTPSVPATPPVATDTGVAESPPPAAAPAPATDNGAPPPPPPPRGGKSFLWPVRGRIIATFGEQDLGTHNDGINIAAARGTPVKAAENGVVVYAGNEIKGFGNLLLVRHADGFMTAYAHNDSLAVHKGEVVRRGQTIARVGSSGNVSEPQLHFEIRRGTQAIDPEPQLGSPTS